MLGILELEGLRQENHEFWDSLGCTARPSCKHKQIKGSTRDGKVASWVKARVAKLGNLSSTPVTRTVEGESKL